MAEALAAVGVAVNILQLADFSAKVLAHLNDFHSNFKEIPKSLRPITTQLPVLQETLQLTNKLVDAGFIGDRAKDALLQAVLGCQEQVKALDALLIQILPTVRDSRTKRAYKAQLSVKQDSEVERIIKKLREYIGILTFYHAAVSSTRRTRKVKSVLAKTRKWLTPPDPSLNYQKALKLRHANTGHWLIKSHTYSAWKEGKSPFVWLHGIPGCGKTILSSTVVQDIQEYCHDDPGKVVVYFYFDFNDTEKRKSGPMIRSLICQLSQYCIRLPVALEQLISSGKEQWQPSLDTLLDILRQLIEEFPRSYIILDALDECTDCAELMDVLEQMARWQLDKMHILVTSRKERDIEISLDGIVEEKYIVPLQSEVVDKDIQIYIRKRLSDDKSLKRWQKDPSTVQEIEEKLTRGAHGMFRWAACQLDSLARCLNRKMLLKTLSDLPSTLDATYERILCSIEADYTEYALRILEWLTFSARPLSLEEVAHAMAIETSRNPAFDRNEVFDEPLDILQVCSSLISIPTKKESSLEAGSSRDSGRKIVLLAHYSVKEFLVSDRILQGPAARYSMKRSTCNESIALKCIGYLLQFKGLDSLTHQSLKTYELARYSAEFWISHAMVATPTTRTLYQSIMALLSNMDEAYYNWIRIYNSDKPWEEYSLDQGLSGIPAPLYYVSVAGYTEILKLLLENGADVNAQGGHYGNALQAASCRGNEAIVKLLLDNGAEINMQGGYYDNALRAALYEGYDDIVKLLLENGADINAQGGSFGNSLRAASYEGHDEIVKPLLENGADISAQGGSFGNALQAALDRDHEATVKLLLENGADVNAQGEDYSSGLQAASCEGDETIVKLLLENGADVNAHGGYYGNALQAASCRGAEVIMKLLLENGADINAQGGFYGNALQAASYRGHEAIVELLLENGADINAQGGHYDNALQAALHASHEVIVKLLLENGADVNAQGGYYGNALQAALCRGAEAVVKLLLENGANINMRGGYYGNALQAASSRGNEAMVNLLCENGADVNAQGGYYGNALQMASYADTEAIVKLLLKNGADINAQGGHYGSALQAASCGGHEAMLELLLENGADINIHGGEYGNALQAASFIGHEEMVKLLLKKGADVNVQGGGYGNALHAASCKGYKAIVKLLLENGADVNAQRGYYGNALQAASYGGHKAVMKMLLENGADINAQGGEHGSALQAALFEGDEETMKLLLENGADVNAQGGFHGNALQAASYEGHEAIVKLLLENGADVNANGGFHGNALQAASYEGHEAIVKLLLENGADVNVQGGEHGSALQAALYEGHEGIMKLLLERGAHPLATQPSWVSVAVCKS